MQKKRPPKRPLFKLICFALHGRSRLVLLVLDTLENEDDDQHRKTRKVGDRAGDDHQQAAGDQRDAADPLHIADQVAHQAGGDRRHTEGRGDDAGGNAQEVDVGANEDQVVIVSKDVGNDESRFETMAKHVAENEGLENAWAPLLQEDIAAIFRASL